MSPLLLTCCVLFLAAFCVLAYVIEHWSFWESTGPRRWGWIQSWAPNGRPIVIKGDPKTTPNPKWTVEDWKKWDKGIRIAREASERQVQASQLYTDGWRCGRFTETGNQTLYRGESEAYVSIKVWTEVERLTKAKWDELHGRPVPKYPLGTDSSPERPAVVGEKGKETIGGRVVEDSFLHLPGKVSDWSAGVYSEKGPDILIKDGIMHVPEVNEVPGTETDFYGKSHIVDAAKYAIQAAKWGAFKFNFDGSNWRKVRSRGSRFLPSVNPLGDTAAYMRTIYYDPIFPPMWLKYADRVSFRHKKGGSRG